MQEFILALTFCIAVTETFFCKDKGIEPPNLLAPMLITLEILPSFGCDNS